MDQEMQSMWRTTQLGPRAPRGTLGTVLKTDGQGRLCLIKGGWLGPTAQGPWARGSVRNAPVSAPNLTPFAKLATFPRFLLRHSGPSQWGRAHSGAALTVGPRSQWGCDSSPNTHQFQVSAQTSAICPDALYGTAPSPHSLPFPCVAVPLRWLTTQHPFDHAYLCFVSSHSRANTSMAGTGSLLEPQYSAGQQSAVTECLLTEKLKQRVTM